MELFTPQQIKNLNELELLVYQYIIEHPNTVPFMRIRELAAEAHVSTTTVLHFCKKVGCDGYAQFKWKLKEQAGSAQGSRLPDTLGELQNFLWKVGTPEYDAALDEAAGMIARAERVFLVGIGNSGSIAEYGARYLSNLGKFALGVTDPFYPITVTPNTTIAAVILSVSGETKQVLHLARQLKEKNAGLIAITCSDQSSAAKLSDITLPYYSSVHRVTTESYDLTSQMPALYLLEALAQLLDLDNSTAAAPEVKQGLGSRIIATMSAVFAPFVYILAAAGLVQGALIIITHFFPAFAATGTYSVLSFISWTPFTFLPVMIAVTASKHFKCNTFIAMWCCMALVNPDWASIAARIADGEVIKFLAFPMSQTTYTSTVLPPLFLVLVLSWLEHWLDEHLPDIIKALAVPFICTIVMVPLTILVIGPVSNVLANAIAAAYNFLANNVPALAAILVGGIWQVFVIFGVHWGVTPMCLANFANYGCDSFQAFQTCAVIAQAAACFGVFLKTKKADIKNVSLSAGLTGIFGITEPAIYGVTLRLKKPFVCGCIGGAIGALIISFFNTKYYVYAGLPGLLTTVNAMSDANPSSFTGMMIGVLATIIITIVLVQVVGCDEKESQKN